MDFESFLDRTMSFTKLLGEMTMDVATHAGKATLKGAKWAGNAALDAMSPLKVLSRGYSIASGENGKIIKKTTDVIVGEKIYVADLVDESLPEKEQVAQISVLLREKILELRDELQRQTGKTEKEQKEETPV